MKIVTKVKGQDDFGKEKINQNLYQYSHHFPRVDKGDYIIYYYPNNKAVGIYQVASEQEYYEKDGFQFCRGTMVRYDKSAVEFIEDMKTKNRDSASTFEKIIINLVEKHSV